MPDYRTRAGRPVEVEFKSEECPKSVMLRSPESMELVQLYYRSKIVGMPPPSKLPIPIGDAFVIIAGEETRTTNALNAGESQDARRERG